MAFVRDFEEEEEQKKAEQNGGSGEGVVLSSGAGGYVGGSGTTAPSTGATQNSSGRWTNLQNYLNTNKEQGEKTQQGLSDALGSKVNTAGNTTAQTTEQTIGAARQGTFTADSGTKNALTSDPTKVDAEKFKQNYGGGYRGPESADYSQADKQIGQVNTFADQLSSTDSGKRHQALDSTYGRPTYSQGQKTLDELVTWQSPDAGQKFETDANRAKSIVGEIRARGGNDVAAAIAGAKDTSLKEQADFRKTFDDASRGATDKLKGLQKSVSELGASNDKAFADTLAGIKALDPAALARVGLSESAARQLVNSGAVAMDKFLKKNTNQSLGDVASNDLQAQFSALKSLGGTVGQDLGSFDFTKAGGSKDAFNTNAGMVGAANEYSGLIDESKRRLDRAQKDREISFNSAISDPMFLRKISGLSEDELAYLFGGADEYETSLNNYLKPAGANQERVKDVLPGYSFDSKKKDTQREFAELKKLVNRGTQLQLGDVMTDAERTRNSELLKMLEFGGLSDFSDYQDEGSAFNFDSASARKMLDSRRAKISALEAVAKAENQKRLKEIEKARKDQESASKSAPNEGGGTPLFERIGNWLSDGNKKKNIRSFGNSEVSSFLNSGSRRS